MADPPSPGRPGLRVALGFLALLALAVLPVCSTVLPPLFDAPNHLARMHLLAEGGNRFYAVRWAPLPNLAEDLIVPALARLMPLDQAARLFLVLILGLGAGGAVWLNRVASGGWRLWPLLGFVLLYNRIFLWGFLNYLFGVALAVIGAALWLGLAGRPALRAAVAALLALACYFSHVEAFVVYGLIVAGIAAAEAWPHLRARDWPALGRQALGTIPPFLAPVALFLAAWRHGAGGRLGYGNFWRKADLLFSVFDTYNRAFDALCFVLFLGLILALAWTGRLGLERRLGWALGLIAAAYLAVPSQIFTGSGADHRLPAAFFLLLVAAAKPRWPSRGVAVTIGSVAALMLVVRFGVIERVWRQADRIYRADLAALDTLPEGALVAVAFPDSAIHVTRVPEIHLATLAIVRREAFVPTLFAYPTQQPIELRPPYDALARAVPPDGLWAAWVGGNRRQRARLWPSLSQFDYVVFTDRGAVHVPPSPCLAPVALTPSFQLLRIVKPADPACAQ